jgi:membrane protein required for colicin V production
LSLVDIIFAILLLFAILRGYSKGLLRTAATYAAPVLGFMIAKDFSDPVRDRLASYKVVPDFATDLFAPVIVFVVVVIIVRTFASLVARLLGVGLGLPGRILGAAVSACVAAVVLGAVVMAVHELRPPERVKISGASAPPSDPVESLLADLNQRFSESLLAPPLEELATTVVARTMIRTPNAPLDRDIREQLEDAAHKAAESAVDSLVKPPHAASAASPKTDEEAERTREQQAKDAPARNEQAKPAAHAAAKPASPPAAVGSTAPARPR